MDKIYYTFKTKIENTIIIKKSEFITSLFPVTNETEIEEILKETRKKYYDATHNCYAYVLGTNLNEKYKCSDDGEPSKTAGAPILDSLQKNNLTNCLCIVTRYFGGIKLGAGGLVRAYSESASEAIAKLVDKEEIIEKENIKIAVSYDLINVILKAMSSYTLLQKDFLDQAIILYSVPKKEKESIIQKIINITNGKANISE